MINHGWTLFISPQGCKNATEAREEAKSNLSAKKADDSKINAEALRDRLM